MLSHRTGSLSDNARIRAALRAEAQPPEEIRAARRRGAAAAVSRAGKAVCRDTGTGTGAGRKCCARACGKTRSSAGFGAAVSFVRLALRGRGALLRAGGHRFRRDHIF